jgi:hypothetical protein
MARTSSGFVIAWSVALSAAMLPAMARPMAPTSEPVEPIAAILDAFGQHSIVALGEVHGNEQSHAVRLALLRTPRFPSLVNDIVVEFGNAKFQPLMDRFIAGGDVADEDLVHVWQDTTQVSGVWDRPIYGDLFRAVRAVNQSLPAGRKLRVLLGDPAVDWELVRRDNDGAASQREGKVRINGIWIEKDRASSLDRDEHAARLVAREVLARQRRALLMFGDGHLAHAGRSVVGRLERSTGTSVFTITNATSRTYDALATARVDVGSWPAPSLWRRPVGPDGSGIGQSDAVLYLGPPSAMTSSRIAPAVCADASYLARRRERMSWAGMPESEAEALLARDCGPQK